MQYKGRNKFRDIHKQKTQSMHITCRELILSSFERSQHPSPPSPCYLESMEACPVSCPPDDKVIRDVRSFWERLIELLDIVGVAFCHNPGSQPPPSLQRVRSAIGPRSSPINLLMVIHYLT